MERLKPGIADAALPADAYEEYQGWPAATAEAVARYLRTGSPRRSLVLGCATGVNDALPLARLAGTEDRILAGDIDQACLERLRRRAASEGLSNLDVRALDVERDLSPLGMFDLVTLLFVIHRLAAWEEVLDRLCGLVAPGGSFFVSEFAGPEGLIYLSNEPNRDSTDPVSRMIRRYFDLLPEKSSPRLKSTSIAPVLKHLSRRLTPEGSRDFEWHQTVMPAEMFRRIRDQAYAPFRTPRPPAGTLDLLRAEFAGEWTRTVRMTEIIRVHRFSRPVADALSLS